jgi:hypothetical protein
MVLRLLRTRFKDLKPAETIFFDPKTRVTEFLLLLVWASSWLPSL